MGIADHVEREIRRHIISRQITDPVSHEVLDIRTARFALNADGEPVAAFSPRVAQKLDGVIASGQNPFSNETWTLEKLAPATDPEHHAERYSPEVLPGYAREILSDVLDEDSEA